MDKLSIITMKRNLIFVVILLTILSIVNAISVPLRKRDTTFGACTTSKAPELDAKTINPVTPDAVKSAIVSLGIKATQANITGGDVKTTLQPLGGGGPLLEV